MQEVMDLQDTYNYLEEFGFDISKLKALVQGKAQTAEQYFQEPQYFRFGDTDMRYELNFLRKNINGDFYLESIRSVYEPSLDIPHLKVDRVDTEDLRLLMGKMDWAAYFSSSQTVSEEAREEIATIFTDLQILSANTDADYIVNDLKISFWPERALTPDLMNLKQAHQRTGLFNPGQDGLWSPALAYYRLSGQLEDLLDKIDALSIPQLPASVLSTEMQKILMTARDEFIFFHSWFDGDSQIKLEVPVKAVEGSFRIDEFHVSLQQLPEIEHGIFNGVDTFLLNAKMTHTDWEAGEQWFSTNTESFKPPVDEILDMLGKLDSDATGADIASYLKLRFFHNNDFFGTIAVVKRDWDYLLATPAIEEKFPVELNVECGVNLLKGGAIYLDGEMFAGQQLEGWLQMDKTSVTETGKHPIEYLQDYTEEQLLTQLNMLPIPNYRYYTIKDRLLNGYTTNLDLKDGMNVFIKADPANCTLEIYDEYKREIPFNFNLDIHWQQVQQPTNIKKIPPETAKEIKQPMPPNPKRQQKKRGRGI